MINGTIFQCFNRYTAVENCLWMQLGQRSDELAQVGFTAVWLPPMTKASGGQADLGYSVYDLYDLGEFDQCGSVATRYGTRQQLLTAIARLQESGLQVYGDVVLHRKHGGDRPESVQATPVAWGNRCREMGPSQSIYAHSQFTFPGRGDRYNAMTWNSGHFQVVNHACESLQPSPSSADAGQWGAAQAARQPPSQTLALAPRRRHRYGLYRLKPAAESALAIDVRFGMARFPQKTAQDAASQLVCELDLAMPEVATAMEDWGRWLLQVTGINGVRVEGANYVPAPFLQSWLNHLRSHGHGTAGRLAGRQQPEKSSLFAVGDYWSNQVHDLHWYIAKTNGQLSLFDVPLHYNFHYASRQGHHYDLRQILTGTLMKQQPTLAVTFVENHNSQLGQLMASPVEEWFKPLAYALILLRQEGYPCVFAADYYGVDGGGNAWLPSHRWLLEKLMRVRSQMAYGKQLDYFTQPNAIGWTRLGNAEHPQAIAVVLSNGEGGQQRMNTGKPHTQFVDITQHMSQPVRTDADGWGAFSCVGRSVSVWVETHEAQKA